MLSHRIPRKQLSPFHHFSIFASLNDVILTRSLMGSNSPANPRVCKVLPTKTRELLSGERYFFLSVSAFCPDPVWFLLCLYQKYSCECLRSSLHHYQVEKLFISEKIRKEQSHLRGKKSRFS